MRMDAEVTYAMLNERVSIHGNVDYVFMRFYFENLVQRLRLLEKALEAKDGNL